jgi:hypothetical protein
LIDEVYMNRVVASHEWCRDGKQNEQDHDARSEPGARIAS